jgi:hypothetical protein
VLVASNLAPNSEADVVPEVGGISDPLKGLKILSTCGAKCGFSLGTKPSVKLFADMTKRRRQHEHLGIMYGKAGMVTSALSSSIDVAGVEDLSTVDLWI